MKLSDFYYDLPKELIAQTPAAQRDQSRLLVYHMNDGRIVDTRFHEIGAYLQPGDCLILNNSRVLPARLVGQRLPGGGICEVLLLNDKGDKVWECLVRPGRKLRKGTRLTFGNGELTAEIVEQLEEGVWRASGSLNVEDLGEALGIEIPANEDYDTLGGMVLSCLRTIPEDGTHPQVTVNGLDIQVEVVEDHRIQSALVRKVEPAEAEKPAEEE